MSEPPIGYYILKFFHLSLMYTIQFGWIFTRDEKKLKMLIALILFVIFLFYVFGGCILSRLEYKKYGIKNNCLKDSFAYLGINDLTQTQLKYITMCIFCVSLFMTCYKLWYVIKNDRI